MLKQFQSAPHEFYNHRVIATYLFCLLPLLTLLWAFTFWFLNQTKERQINNTIQSSFNKIDYVHRFGSWQINSATETSELLVNQLKTFGFEGVPSHEMLERIESLWADTMRARKQFLQFRLVDLYGQELARVDYDPQTDRTHAPEQLQFKGNRDYVQQAFKLKDHEILVTVPEANMEWGEVSQPLVGVMRIVRPIFQGDGRRDGYLILNFSVEELLESLRHIPGFVFGEPTTVTTDGYYLSHSDPSFVYGHQLPERSGHRFSLHFPDAWAIMQTQTSGTYISDQDIFVFEKLPFADPVLPLVTWPYQDTFLVKRVPLSLIDEAITVKKYRAVILASFASTLLAILLLPACYLLAIRTKRNRESRLAKVAMDSLSAAVITDKNGRIVDVNRRFTDITGYSEQEAIGQNPNMLSSGMHDDAYFHEFWRVLLNTGFWSGEIWNMTKDGVIYPQFTEIQAVHNRKGIVKYFVASFIDITEQKQVQQQLLQASIHDPLTGCLNRRGLDKHLDHHIELFKRHQTPYCIALIDIDFFKKINDKWGHDTGDEVLIKFVQYVKSQLRQTDFFARMGGEEFIILMPVTELEGATKLLERIRSRASQYQQEVRYTFSVGVTEGEKGDSRSSVSKRADVALYYAKNHGRNQVRVYTNDGNHWSPNDSST